MVDFRNFVASLDARTKPMDSLADSSGFLCKSSFSHYGKKIGSFSFLLELLESIESAGPSPTKINRQGQMLLHGSCRLF